MHGKKVVKMSSFCENIEIKNRKGTTICRLQLFDDGSLYVHQAKELLIQLKYIEKHFLEMDSIKDPDYTDWLHVEFNKSCNY